MRHALRSQEAPQENIVNDQENDSEENDSDEEVDNEESQVEDGEAIQDSEAEINPVVITQEESDRDEEESQDSAPGRELDPNVSRSAKTPKLKTPHKQLAETPSLRPKRRVKPVVRLAYDGLGKAKDQPITIIHRGVVITIGKD